MAVALEVTLILLIVGLCLGMINDSKGRQAGIGADVLVNSHFDLSKQLLKEAGYDAAFVALAGIALTFIAIGFLFRAYARPIIGLGTGGGFTYDQHPPRPTSCATRPARRWRRTRAP